MLFAASLAVEPCPAGVEQAAPLPDPDAMRLPFVANEGQVRDSAVKFIARTFSGAVYVRNDGEILYFLPKYERSDGATPAAALDGEIGRPPRRITAVSVVKERLLDASGIVPMGIQPSDVNVNYFIGDPSRWRSEVPAYGAVDMGLVYDGIRLQIRARGKNVEKVFLVEAGADPSQIRLALDGVESLSIADSGELELRTELGPVKFSAPVAYQLRDGLTEPVGVEYAVAGHTFGFALGQYDSSLPLVIDPLLASTFLGGQEDDVARGVAFDETGMNVFIAGYTASTDFPLGTNSTPYSSYVGGASDAFVAAFNPRLSILKSMAFIGGAGADEAFGLAFHDSNVILAGCTDSTDFPTTPSAYDTTYNGNGDAFVCVLNPSLSLLRASSFFGGSSNDCATAVAVDASGNITIAGYTSSTNCPTRGIGGDPLSTQLKGPQDAFVAKFPLLLGSLTSGTLLGGGGSDRAYAVALNPSDSSPFVAGWTDSTDFPTSGGAYQTTRQGPSCAFLTLMNNNMQMATASTYLGGTMGDDCAYAVAVNSLGEPVVAGRTWSFDFPTGGPELPISTSLQGPSDGFVTRMPSHMMSMSASTFFGGNNDDGVLGIAIDNQFTNVFTVGFTDSDTGFPATTNAYDITHNGAMDGFAARMHFNLTSTRPRACTYLGGASDDELNALAYARGSVFTAGYSESGDYPVMEKSYEVINYGNKDAVLSRLSATMTVGTLRWVRELDGSEALSAPTLSMDGSIHVSTMIGKLYSFDDEGYTNLVWWPVTLDNNTLPEAHPSVDLAGNVYVGLWGLTNALAAYAPDAEPAGEPRFLYSSQNSGGTKVTAAISSETNIFFGTTFDRYLVSLTAAGETNWIDTLPSGSAASGSPALSSNGNIVIGTDQGVYSFDAATGTTNWWLVGATNWAVGTNFTVDAPMALGDDGSIYFGTMYGASWRTNVFVSVKPDGSTNWVRTVGGSVLSSAVVSSNDFVYFTVSNVVYRYTTAGAGGTFSKLLPDGVYTNRSSPVLGANGSIFVACRTNLYCINTTTPTPTTNWVYHASVTGQISSAAIDTEGNIYFTCGNKLFSLYGSEPMQMGPWPMANHDFMRSGNQGFVPLPQAPNSISATKGDYLNRIRIDWTNAPNAERYELWRGTNSDTASITSRIAAVKLTYYFDSNVEPGKRYYYRVKGRNVFGISDFSAVYDYGGTPPSASAGTSATKGDPLDKINVNWQPVAYASGYRLFRSQTQDTNTAALISIQTTTNYVDTNIVRGVTYYYWTRTTNEFGMSAFSPDDYGGTPPTEISISAGDGTSMDHIELNWTNLPGQISYQLWRSTSAAFGTASNIALLKSPTNSLQDGGADIIPWRTYYYWMRTTNEFGMSAVGPMAQGRRALYAPSAISASDGGAYTTKVQVVWPSSGFATGYRLYRNTSDTTNGAALLVLTQETIYEDTGVNAGATYYYWVQAVNDYGHSAITGPDSGGIPPAPPIALNASDGLYADRIAVTWTGSSGSTGYSLLRGTSIDPGFAQVIATLSGESYDDTNVLPGTRYYYWVKASSPYGSSRLSGSDAGWVSLSAPANIWATRGEYTNKVVVTWSASAGASAYDLYRNTTDDSGSAGKIAFSGELIYEDESVQPGSNYYYWVRAKTVVFSSGLSVSAMGYAASGMADLRASDLVFLPSTIGLFSSPSAVSLRLSNLGPRFMFGDNSSVAVDFYLSANTTFGDADDAWMGSVNTAAVLDAGDSMSVILSSAERSAIVVPYVDTGDYHVFASVRHRYPSTLLDPDPANSRTRRAEPVTVKSFSLTSPSDFNDFSGDGKADLAVYNPLTGAWYIMSLAGTVLAWNEQFGAAGMIPVMGDFDGDHKADLAVYDTATGNWFARRLGGPVLVWGFNWGGPAFVPVVGDFDGDGAVDFAVYNASSGNWFIKSSTGSILAWAVAWGGPQFSPVPGDYSGDGKQDMAVYRPASWSWYIRTLSGDVLVAGDTWGGAAGFDPVPGDFDGDGYSDLAIYHEASGYWFIRSAAGALLAWGEYWGGPGFAAVPGDYNADGISDLAVYDQARGLWFVRTLDGGILAWGVNWGGPDLIPVGAGYWRLPR